MHRKKAGKAAPRGFVGYLNNVAVPRDASRDESVVQHNDAGFRGRAVSQ